MPLETEVRRYRPSDKNPLWRVHDEALRASALDFSPEYNRYLRHVESQFLDVGGEFLVVEVSADEHEEISLENIVAIGGYQPFGILDASDRGPVDVPADEAVRVRSVGVKPDLQSQGVGTALMSELEARPTLSFATSFSSLRPVLSGHTASTSHSAIGGRGRRTAETRFGSTSASGTADAARKIRGHEHSAFPFEIERTRLSVRSYAVTGGESSLSVRCRT